jgi:hypothetical protein
MKPLKVMKEYIKAFSSKNVSKIIPFYSFPLTILDKNAYNKNPHLIIKNKTELKKYFGDLYKILNALFRYKKTKIKKIKLIKSNKNYCVIELHAERINDVNKIFNKIKLLYFLKKYGKNYKICSFIV